MNNPDMNEKDEDLNDGSLFDILDACLATLRLMRRNILAVILILAVFSLGTLGYSLLSYEPIYEQKTTFSITPLVASDSTSGVSVYQFNYVSSFAEQMSETFPFIVESDNLLDLIRHDLGGTVNGTISAEAVHKSNIFEVRVQSSSAEDANNIMESFSRCYPNLAEYILGDTKINVIHSTGLQTQPYNAPNHLRNTLLGMLAGLLLSIGLFFILAQRRVTVRNKNEIKTKLNSKCICEVPEVVRKRTTRSESSLLKMSGRIPSFSEAVRTLKKRVRPYLRDGEKVIAITSTTAKEGKTTLAYNLALAFVKGGERVLLVDMTQRTRGLQEHLRPHAEKVYGITDVVKGAMDLDLAIHPQEEHLDILFAGSQTCSYSDPAYEKVFSQVREKYDIILVDMPSCLNTPEVALVANLCDVLLYTVTCDYMTVDSIKKALQFVLYSKARLLGFVLNRCVGTTGGYGGYGGYSGYSGRYRSYGRYRRYNKHYGANYHSGYSTNYNVDGVQSHER